MGPKVQARGLQEVPAIQWGGEGNIILAFPVVSETPSVSSTAPMPEASKETQALNGLSGSFLNLLMLQDI